MLQLISLLVENKPGALMRITGVLSARGYNIESLTVARTLDPTLSRMTIVVDIEPQLRSQVIKQMNKLVNVLQAVRSDRLSGRQARNGAVARARAARQPYGDPKGSGNLRRSRGGFFHRGFRAGSDGRFRKAGRISST